MRYQVKFQDKGETCYGIAVGDYDAEAQEAAKRGNVLVAEAITGEEVEVPESQITDLPPEFDGEYNQYITKAFEDARKHSDNLGEGLQVGKLFHVGVGDGYAYYEVTKVNKKTTRIEWRGYCPDRWHDAVLSWGGSFPRDRIEDLVARCDGIAAIFG